MSDIRNLDCRAESALESVLSDPTLEAPPDEKLLPDDSEAESLILTALLLGPILHECSAVGLSIHSAPTAVAD